MFLPDTNIQEHICKFLNINNIHTRKVLKIVSNWLAVQFYSSAFFTLVNSFV